MDWKKFHELDVIYGFLNSLAEQYPAICSVIVIGQSVEGRDIKMMKVSSGRCGKRAVWVDGAIHAREWASVAVVTYLLDDLVRNYHTQPASVTDKDWYIVPVLNPDGYQYSFTHDRMWRKNRRQYGECIGVDLNRNFSHGWGVKEEKGSSDDPGSIFYRGPQPFSEPETAAVRDFIMSSGVRFKVFLSFHSYGEAIIFPWGCSEDPCPDYVKLLHAGCEMAKAIYETTGVTYRVGSTNDLMSYCCGASIDWSYQCARIPYSITVELRSKRHRFLLPADQILETAKENLNAVKALLEVVDTDLAFGKTIYNGSFCDTK